MKVAQVAVYLDSVQMKQIRDDAEEAVLSLDDDLEVTTQISDLTARRLAREALDARRSVYMEIVDKMQEKLDCGVYELMESSSDCSSPSAAVDEATRRQ